jgi:hypothetical protein
MNLIDRILKLFGLMRISQQDTTILPNSPTGNLKITFFDDNNKSGTPAGGGSGGGGTQLFVSENNVEIINISGGCGGGKAKPNPDGIPGGKPVGYVTIKKEENTQ